MVGAISFVEAPLKFRAPNITLALGLGIGKLVFQMLNRIEIVFAVLNARYVVFRASGGRFRFISVSLIGLGGVETPMLVQGAVDKLISNTFCENFVRPCLRVGDVLILDNLGAYRASRIEEIAASCGTSVIWLPPYSPDFSPIEQMWSRVENSLKKSQGANDGRT